MRLKRYAWSAAVLVVTAAGLEAAPVRSSMVISVSTFGASAIMPSPSTATWRTVPNSAFVTGEDLRYVVKWGLVVAGYSDLSVKEIVAIDRRPTYHIVSSARSGGVVSAFYKVQDTNEVWLDQGALVTVRYEKRIREGKYQIEASSLLDQIHHRWKTRAYRLDKNSYEEKEGDLPPDVLDAFGSLYYVRTLPLDVDHTYTFDVHDNDKVYPLVVDVLKRETIKVPAGRFDCLRVQVFLRGPGLFVAKGKKLEVWMTADQSHVPVRMRSEIFIGHISAELLPEESNDTDAAQ